MTLHNRRVLQKGVPCACLTGGLAQDGRWHGSCPKLRQSVQLGEYGCHDSVGVQSAADGLPRDRADATGGQVLLDGAALIRVPVGCHHRIRQRYLRACTMLMRCQSMQVISCSDRCSNLQRTPPWAREEKGSSQWLFQSCAQLQVGLHCTDNQNTAPV